MAKVNFRVSEDVDLFLNNTYRVNGVDVALPSQSGQSGKYLKTDGTSASWEAAPFNYAEETTLTTTSATTIDTIALSTFTGAEFIVSFKQGSKVRTSKIIMQTDGTSVDISEYAIVETGGTISGVDISATVSGSNALLQATVTDADVTNAVVIVLRINGEQTASGIVTTSGVQTLTNKTLDSVVLTGSLTLPSGSITSAMIANGTITTDDLKNGSVTSDKIVDNTIVNADINSAAAIDQSKINGLVTDLAAKANLAGATFTGAISGTDLTLSGNLIVNGTTTNINSTNLVVEDKNIVIGDTTSPSDATADGGGITLKGTTDKTINWVDSTDAWTSSEHINLVSGKSFKVNNIAISAALPALTWGDLKNGKSGLIIS